MVLLTDDVSLANKSLANGVPAAGSARVRETLECQQEGGQAGRRQEGGQGAAVSLAPAQAQGGREEVARVRAALREVLEAVLVREFQLAYGEQLWRQIVSIKPSPRYTTHHHITPV